MEIYVLGRSRFDHVMEKNGIDDSNVAFIKDAFFISILSTKPMPASNFHLPVFNNKHPNVMTLSFDDVGIDGLSTFLTGDPNNLVVQEKGGIPMNDDQAERLVDFIISHKNKNVAFIHCAAGISRSGAIGAFINDLAGQKYADFKRFNPQVHENPLVKSLLNKKYNERNIG